MMLDTENHEILKTYKDNIHIVTEHIPNDISATRVRKAVKDGASVKFFVPDLVIDYIHDKGIFQKCWMAVLLHKLERGSPIFSAMGPRDPMALPPEAPWRRSSRSKVRHP